MGTLLLIRHGRTDANASGILAGRTPGVVLDEVGRDTTKALSLRLKEVKVAQVVVSPLERTQETASLLFDAGILLGSDYPMVLNLQVQSMRFRYLQRAPLDQVIPLGDLPTMQLVVFRVKR